jgi:hypothetical protein
MADDPYMRLQGFLEGMRRLTRRYGVAVGGSGDLGSPWVHAAKDGTVLMENLTYCKKCAKYGPNADHADCEN